MKIMGKKNNKTNKWKKGKIQFPSIQGFELTWQSLRLTHTKTMQRYILNGTHSSIFRLNHIEFLYTLHQQQTAAYKLKLRKHIRRGMVCKTCSFLKLILANLFRRKGKHHKTNKKVPSALMLLHPNYSFSFP